MRRFKRRPALTVAACVVVASISTKVAAFEVGERGDFVTLGVKNALPPWWWILAIVPPVLLVSPAVLWRRRWGYAATVCLALSVVTACEWKRSFRGQEAVSVLSWRDGADGAMYENVKQICSSAGGFAMSYRVLCVQLVKPSQNHAQAFAEFEGGPDPRLVFTREDLLSYPGFSPDTSLGLFPYRGTYKHGLKTLAVQCWSKPLRGGQRFGTVVFDGIVAPFWFLILLLCIPPFFWVLRTWRLKRRKAANRCLHCGYDLRASVGQCPECGAPIPQSPNSRLGDSKSEPGKTSGQ